MTLHITQADIPDKKYKENVPNFGTGDETGFVFRQTVYARQYGFEEKERIVR